MIYASEGLINASWCLVKGPKCEGPKCANELAVCLCK